MWDHAFFSGGECRVMNLQSGMRGMPPSGSVVCVECGTQKGGLYNQMETCTNELMVNLDMMTRGWENLHDRYSYKHS